MKVVIPYKPQSHQRQLHDCNTSLVCITGRQVGKTVAAVNELIKRALINKGWRVWYVTNDYRQAKRNVWDVLKYYCPKEIIEKKNESELSITIKNGSKIELVGVENVDSLRGATVNFMILDEYADFKREVYEKVLEPMFSTTNGQVWFLGTPKGLGNDLYYKYTENNGFRKFKFPGCRLVGDTVESTLSEYANKDRIQKIYDKAKNEGRVDYFKQEYLAEFTRPSGTVYKEWPVTNFIDVPYDENLPLHVTFDFGVNDPTAIIWIQPNGGETRVIDYYEASDADIRHFIQVLNSKPYKKPDLCTGDIAGRARELTTGKSPITVLQEGGYWIRTSKIPSIPAQVRAAHEKVPHLFIDKTKAARFRDIILNYRYPEKREGLRDESNEIPIHDQWSHGAKAWEYWTWNFRPESQNIESKRQKTTGGQLLNSIEEMRRARKILEW